ncbi:MAG: hypothetical protein Q9172_004962 [Xanthocarpia lactea]
MPRRIAWETMRAYIANPIRYRVWWTGATARRLRAGIERIASSVGVRLLAKQEDGTPSMPARRFRRRVSSPSLSGTSDGDEDRDSGSSDGDITRRKLFREPGALKAGSAKITLGLLTPPSSQVKRASGGTQVGSARVVPSIAFRVQHLTQGPLAEVSQAFDKHSQGLNGINGFVAGMFVGSTSIPGPPNQTEYLNELERHLAPRHSGPTPFISVSQYLMRVIIHAYRLEREKGRQITDWNIAVINLSQVKPSVKEVQTLAAGYNAQRAFGEWVVYGSIPASNVLSVIPLNHLVDVMSNTIAPFHVGELSKAGKILDARTAMRVSVTRQLTYDDGLAMGRLLLCLGIPKRYVDEITGSMLYDWKYPEFEKGAWMNNEGFVRGRDGAFATGLAVGFVELSSADLENDARGNVGLREITGLDTIADDGALVSSSSHTIDGNYNDQTTGGAAFTGGTSFSDFLRQLEEAALGELQVDGAASEGVH